MTITESRLATTEGTSLFTCVYTSLLGCLSRFVDGKGDVGVVGIINFLDDDDNERDFDEGLLLKYDRNFAEVLRREWSSRTELRVDELHLDLNTRCWSPFVLSRTAPNTSCDLPWGE